MGCGGPGVANIWKNSGRRRSENTGGCPPVGRSGKVLKAAVMLIWNWNHTKIGVQQVLISAAKRKITTKKLPPQKIRSNI